jgi:hypothetical protein
MGCENRVFGLEELHAYATLSKGPWLETGASADHLQDRHSQLPGHENVKKEILSTRHCAGAYLQPTSERERQASGQTARGQCRREEEA